jgi:hypothetical protein
MLFRSWVRALVEAMSVVDEKLFMTDLRGN